MPGKSRFGSPYDAVLHLLDRQVIDRDGLLVCKVDDLELVEDGDGLRATALLAGRAALFPRLGGRLGGLVLDYWERLGAEQAERRDPYRIGFGAVEEVTSAVQLRVPRTDLLVRTSLGAGHRALAELLRSTVRDRDGRVLGGVLDVRLDERHRVAGLVVGPGRPGSMLGYDRSTDQGPALVRVVVRWLHRHAVYVRWEHVDAIDWDAGAVTVAGEHEPVRPAS